MNQALAIEEKYEIIISNYIEFEKQVANEIISNMTILPFDLEHFLKSALSLNIRLVNLLTSFRLYGDQLSKHITSCFSGKQKLNEKIKKWFSYEYDNNFEYRFMEALRNHVQHSGLPVHNYSVKYSWNNDRSQLHNSLYFSAKKSELISNNKFKKSIINEMPEDVDLLNASRSYIESISRIHSQARELIDYKVKESRRIIGNAITECKKIYKKEDDPIIFALLCKGDDLVEKIPVSLYRDDIRVKFITRNKFLGNISKCRLIS